MRAVANRSVPAAEIHRARKPRRQAAGQREARHAADRVRDLAPASCASAARLCTCTAPSLSSRSSADASSISAAAFIAFSRTSIAARCTALPAVTAWRLAKAPKPSGLRRGVAGDHVMLSGGTLEHVAAELRQHRLGALALRGRAGRDDDLARRRRCEATRSRTVRGRSPRRNSQDRARCSGLRGGAAPAAPENPPSRRLRARGAGIPDSRRCRRSWSRRRAA